MSIMLRARDVREVCRRARVLVRALELRGEHSRTLDQPGLACLPVVHRSRRGGEHGGERGGLLVQLRRHGSASVASLLEAAQFLNKVKHVRRLQKLLGGDLCCHCVFRNLRGEDTIVKSGVVWGRRPTSYERVHGGCDHLGTCFVLSECLPLLLHCWFLFQLALLFLALVVAEEVQEVEVDARHRPI